MTKRILVVQNSPTSPIGLVGEVFEQDGIRYDLIQPFKGAALPTSPDHHDGLVILGGPQNALADDSHPYLPDLTKLTRAFGDADKAVAGICLGAQLIARAYGAENFLGGDLEFGYHLVHPLEGAQNDPVLGALSEPTRIFQWHSDTFSRPAGAIHLAKSDMTKYQAFKIDRAVYAFQFHFELTPTTLDMWRDLAEQRFGDTCSGWRETFKSGRASHADKAEQFGRNLTRAWLTQVV